MCLPQNNRGRLNFARSETLTENCPLQVMIKKESTFRGNDFCEC